jgi:PAS domain S-box-containing protein
MSHSPLPRIEKSSSRKRPKSRAARISALAAAGGSQGSKANRIVADDAASCLKQESSKRRLLARRLKELKARSDAMAKELLESKRAATANRLQLEVLNNIPAVAWTVTPDGQCDFINRFYLEATGLSQEECLAPLGSWKKTPDSLPPFLSGLHPDHRGRAAATFWGGIRSGQGWAFDAPFLHSDGQYHWHFDRAVPLRDTQGNIARFVGTCADIDELRIAQRELKDTQKRLEAIVDGSPSLIFLKDVDGRYVLINREFARSFGIDRTDIVGKTDAELFMPEQAIAFRRNDLKVIEAAAPIRFEAKTSTVDGLRHSIVQSFPLFDDAGCVQAVGGVAFDITDRKRAEDALRDAQADLARVNRLTAIDALTTSIAHEINQPLAAIATNATTCLHWLDAKHANHGKAADIARQMRKDAMRASDIIVRIRALMTRTKPERTLVEINSLIRDVLILTNGELRRHSVEVRTELSESLPTLLGDRVQLKQVILNLILNALEAMVPVCDRRRLLSVSSVPGADKTILVRVSDNGIGIASGEADKLFSAFFTTKSKGTGLGLSICRSIIETHDGRISARPASPHGATFEFSVPAEPVQYYV